MKFRHVLLASAVVFAAVAVLAEGWEELLALAIFLTALGFALRERDGPPGRGSSRREGTVRPDTGPRPIRGLIPSDWRREAERERRESPGRDE